MFLRCDDMKVHIINHTHWDREWFLSSVYTTHWIPGLIDRLIEIAAENRDFRYFFDGQTLVVEDLLKAYPDYRPKVEKLIRDGNLTIGPYYCQPDWKLTPGELLIRNIEYGQKDAAALGQEPSASNIGWLVDTFGHISQSPQIHKMHGIDAVYVWRGMPQMVPYFDWVGANGESVFGVNLFGGYRNLYGITHVPELAERRLQSEIEKLSPYYPTADLPLFDGYDLEDNPEDPVTFLAERGSREGAEAQSWEIQESTPSQFVADVRPKLTGLPTLQGELNSGKYGATFPGTYSARTYLKVMQWDCVTLLTKVCEPLAVMAWAKGREYEADKYEQWSRLLLQNAVHDCICGVSIDLVHEKMEDIYWQVGRGVSADIEESLKYILGDFASGWYEISTNPMAGMGVQPTVPEVTSARERVQLVTDGFVVDGVTVRFRVSAEHGDTYSDETGEVLGYLKSTGEVKISQSDQIGERFELKTDALDICADVHFIAADELVRVKIDLDVRDGVDFRIDMVADAADLDLANGKIFAGMPFDVMERRVADTDLLPRELSGDLAKIMLGQRELNQVTTFPFHDFVAVEAEKTLVAMAAGLHSYSAVDGAISVTLCRSVEWLTKPNLENRIGDAGPFFYVPGARGVRIGQQFEVAVMVGDFAADSLVLQRLNAAFQTSTIKVPIEGTGDQIEWDFCRSDVPLSTMQVVDGKAVARYYNPTTEPNEVAAPKQVVSQQLTISQTITEQKAELKQWPSTIGRSSGAHCVKVDDDIIHQLHKQVAEEQQKLVQIGGGIEAAELGSAEQYRAQHRYYITEREMLEYQLSARLNEMMKESLGCRDNLDLDVGKSYQNFRKVRGELMAASSALRDKKLRDPGLSEEERKMVAIREALPVLEPEIVKTHIEQRQEMWKWKRQYIKLNKQYRHNYLYERDPQVVEIGWQLNQLRIKRRIFDYVVAALD